MKKLILLFVILSITSLPETYAQFGFGNLEDIQQIKKVPLIVVLLESHEKTVKKLTRKKDGSLEKYYADIDAYNTAVKKAFGNTWNFSDEIKYVTAGELEKYNTKQNNGKYAYFRQLIDPGDISNTFYHKGAITTYNYAIYLTGKRKPVYSYMYSTLIPNEADFKFISQQIQYYLQFREVTKSKEKSRKEVLAEIKANTPLLKEKTLLIEEKNLSKGVQNSLGDLYKYAYRIASKEEIEEAILTDAKDIAYLKVLPVGQISDRMGPVKTSELIYMQYVINAETGEHLAYVTPSPIRVPGVLGMLVNDDNFKLKKNDLLSIVKDIEGGAIEK